MNENQKKWLQDLLDKGVVFEFYNEQERIWASKSGIGRPLWFNKWDKFRIPVQPIPDIPDWREVCRDMQSKGARFEEREADGSGWFKAANGFSFTIAGITRFRIAAQPIPEWREEMEDFYAGKLADPDYKKAQKKLSDQAKAIAAAIEEKLVSDTQLDKIPHRELQIQWHEDCIHALKTGEPMREWEYRNEAGYWNDVAYPSWLSRYEYRRKPRMKKVTLWYCVARFLETETGVISTELCGSTYDKDEVESEMQHFLKTYPTAKFSPIIETTVEIPED